MNAAARYAAYAGLLVALVIGVLPGTSHAGTCKTSPMGDVTADGAVDITDVVCVVKVAVWSRAAALQVTPVPTCVSGDPLRADLDCTATVTIRDAQVALRLASSGALPHAMDSDADGCPDLCSWACGDGICQAAEDCASCAADCGGCNTSCYATHEKPGCADAAIQTCACSLDATCCTDAWTATCVGLARAACSQTCCAPHGGTACSNATCAGCVCAIDASCCDKQWSPSCVSITSGPCSTHCGCTK